MYYKKKELGNENKTKRKSTNKKKKTRSGDFLI